MTLNKYAEIAKAALPLLVAIGIVKIEAGDVKREVADGVQKVRIADKTPMEYELRDLNARIFIVETALRKRLRLKKVIDREQTLAEYALSPTQARILKDDLRSAVKDVLREIDDTPVLD